MIKYDAYSLNERKWICTNDVVTWEEYWAFMKNVLMSTRNVLRQLVHYKIINKLWLITRFGLVKCRCVKVIIKYRGCSVATSLALLLTYLLNCYLFSVRYNICITRNQSTVWLCQTLSHCTLSCRAASNFLRENKHYKRTRLHFDLQ